MALTTLALVLQAADVGLAVGSLNATPDAAGLRAEVAYGGELYDDTRCVALERRRERIQRVRAS